MAANKIETIFANNFCIANVDLILKDLSKERIIINSHDITPINKRTRAELVNLLKVVLTGYRGELVSQVEVLE